MLWLLSAASGLASAIAYFAWATAVEDDRTGHQLDTLVTGALFWVLAIAAIGLATTAIVRSWRRRRARRST
jgi:hypothetical protein